MKKYILIALLAGTQIFNVTARSDFTTNKAELQKQIDYVVSKFSDVTKFEKQKDLQSTDFYFTTQAIKQGLDSAQETIKQMKELNLTPAQKTEFNKLEDTYNQLRRKYQLSFIFKKLSYLNVQNKIRVTCNSNKKGRNHG